MSNLYYLKYTQESEVYVEANSEEEAQEKIEEYTKNGGENMYNIRLNHCGWRVKNSYTDLKPVDDRGDFEHSHTTLDGGKWISTDVPDGYYEW